MDLRTAQPLMEYEPITTLAALNARNRVFWEERTRLMHERMSDAKLPATMAAHALASSPTSYRNRSVPSVAAS